MLNFFNSFDNSNTSTRHLELAPGGKALKRLVFQRPIWGTDVKPRPIPSGTFSIPGGIKFPWQSTPGGIAEHTRQSDELCRQIQCGHVMPPAIAFYDGSRVWLANQAGFDAYYAGQRTGTYAGLMINAIIFEGSEADAEKYYNITG